MLSSRPALKITLFFNSLLLVMLLFVSACLPEQTPAINSGNNSTNPETPSTSFPDPTFPLSGVFITEGGQHYSSNFSIPTDFNDSFRVRGKSVSQFLRTIAPQTKLCLVSKFNYGTGSDKFLVLSAKIQTETILANKTSEYFLRAEPNNKTVNETDCLNYNLSNKLLNSSQFPNPTLEFSISSLCQDCSSLVTGTGFMLYYANGEAVSAFNTQSLIMSLTHNPNGGGGQACFESSLCKGQGFDCCLEGQCVKDRAERPDAYQKPRYLEAKDVVKNNPARYVLYPEIYFVCTQGTTTGSTGGGEPPTDPAYEAAKRVRELQHLHDCLNKVDGDFSFCSVKYEEAYKSMPGTFTNTESVSDINFSSVNSNLASGKYANNIYRIFYAGEVVYDQELKPTVDPAKVAFGTPNDNLSQSQPVTLNLSLPTNAPDAVLYLTYKIDGTCDKQGSTRAKCTKTFYHDANDSEKYSSTWHNANPFYALPTYADLTGGLAVTVKVNEIILPMSDANWKIQGNGILFVKPLYKGQKVEITYFVTQNVSNLLSLKNTAQTKLNSICACDSSSKCNLKPIKASNDTIINYECIYESPDSGEPPVNQKVNINSKNVPARYFDHNGVASDTNYGSAEPQEGTEFNYVSRNTLRPNNISQYIGFNEIYGSFAALAGQDAQPAKMIRVKKDVTYDIMASGHFSPCTNCGNDYYGNQLLFPFNAQGGAGGYSPDKYASSRTTNTGLYRADDLLYGRACFVPATMIPWTHTPSTSVESQRRNRLAAQHFLFSNGYQRDWYGFDYGSVIGSFDGVTWFSVGSLRRIKAKSNKLFLAVNTYAGDLNSAGNFDITVSEMVSGSSRPIPEKDFETDGAECQSMHQCSTNNDCFAQLGYEYSCEPIAGITSKWPIFDNNASELIDPAQSPRTLTSILGGVQTNAKRCVYRGRGAPCVANLNGIANTENTFNTSSFKGTQMCSTNNYCASTDTSQFNDRIARYGVGPVIQNTSTFPPTKSDTHGLGARVLLRPYDFIGTKNVPAQAKTALTGHKVHGVCIPGKELTSATSTFDLNSRVPGNRLASSDRILGLGTTSSLFSTRSMNACPATDHAGNNIHGFDSPLGDPTLNLFTFSQNLSTNLLNFPAIADAIYSTTNGSLIQKAGYQPNACLRAPGASCFSDMECAPSPFIASKVKATSLTSLLNQAEIKYWSEELVCGNPDFKYVSPGVFNPNFDPKKNTCCRDFGNAFTVFTETDSSDFKWCTPTKQIQLAGLNVDFKAASRYSRVNTAYDKITCNPEDSGKTFALSLKVNASTDPEDSITRFKQILTQYKTLSTINERTCCTKSWVRNFADENGGGHAFSKSKLQNIDKSMFKYVSWVPQNTSTGVVDDPFECLPTNYGDSSCEVKNFTQAEEDKYLSWAASLELVGIPQVAIGTNDVVAKLVDDQQLAPGASLPLTDSDGRDIVRPIALETADFKDGANTYYSGSSYNKLNMESTNKNSLKKVFSENEFNCCIPTGKEVPSNTTASQCCTGYLANIGVTRCCLPDLTDVTLYLNRYVSSEGGGLPESAYDPKTGYIKDPGLVQQIAAQKNICCSGTVMTGVAISRLIKPIKGGNIAGIPHDSPLASTRRFVYRDDIIDNNSQTGSIGTKFDAGIRWNNHLYCVPQNFGN